MLISILALKGKCLALAILAKDNVCIPFFVLKKEEDMIWKKQKKKRNFTFSEIVTWITSEFSSKKLQMNNVFLGFKNLH